MRDVASMRRLFVAIRWHEPGKRAYLVKDVEAYRNNHISREQLLSDPPAEGYFVRGS